MLGLLFANEKLLNGIRYIIILVNSRFLTSKIVINHVIKKKKCIGKSKFHIILDSWVCRSYRIMVVL